MTSTTLLIAQLPSVKKKNAEIHRQEAAEVRRHLLQAGLREAGIPIAQADRIERSPDGKPRLSDYPAFHFNLSHSGDYIACIFSTEEIGLDLQEHRRPAGSRDSCLRIARRFFTAQEYDVLKALQAPEAGPDGNHALPEGPDRHLSGPEDPVIRLFSHLWVLKEAYLKYIGCGLRGSMDSFYPLPLPEPGDCGNPEAFFPRAAFPNRWSTSKRTDTPFQQHPDSLLFPEPQIPVHGVRGKIEVLKDTALFHPADYALLPAPDGYSLAVCAKKLPEEICMRLIR